MEKGIIKGLTMVFLFASVPCLAGTAGPSDDEIWLLIIPLIILILYIGLPWFYRFIRDKVAEFRKNHPLANQENGFTGA